MYEDENNLYHYSYRKGDEQNPNAPIDTKNYAEDPWDKNPGGSPKKKGGSGLSGKIVALALVCALVGGFIGAGVSGATTKVNKTSVQVSDREVAQVQTVKVDGKTQMSMSEVYASNVNSVVSINVSATTNYFGQTVQTAASGTGFFITEDGYILTNHHVISDASSVKVTLYNGETYDAKVIGSDEDYDIAVLKIDVTGATPVVLGDSSKVAIGESVAAVGNPLGELTFSLTTGVVSALDRPVTLSTGTTMNLIQTDCAINSGNSGGALFNLYGEVIGITNAKYSSSGSSSEASIDNIGFAIPIDQVRSIFESIITNGYIVKPYIGVTVSDVSSESQSYGLPQGAAVRSVTENGPAAEAGLQENDIITAVNGETITGSNDLVKLVKASAAGDTLELTVYRQGQTTTLTLTVGEQKTDALPAQNTDQNQQSQQGYYDGGQSGQSDNQFGGSWPFGFGFGG